MKKITVCLALFILSAFLFIGCGRAWHVDENIRIARQPIMTYESFTLLIIQEDGVNEVEFFRVIIRGSISNVSNGNLYDLIIKFNLYDNYENQIKPREHIYLQEEVVAIFSITELLIGETYSFKAIFVTMQRAFNFSIDSLTTA